jgi:hypothetical protein
LLVVVKRERKDPNWKADMLCRWLERLAVYRTGGLSVMRLEDRSTKSII